MTPGRRTIIGVRWRLIDESGETVGELPDAEAVWGKGDQITLDGEDFEVVTVGGRVVSDLGSDPPLLVVRRL